MFKGRGLSILVALLLGFCLVSNAEDKANVDAVIAEAVKGGNKEMSQISKMPQFTGGKCYRDGKKKGVVFEYVYDKAFSPPSMDAKTMKDALKKALAGKPDVKQITNLGIYFRFIYKAPDGKPLCDVTLTSKDLGS